MPVLQYPNFLYINILVQTNEICSYKSDAHLGDGSFNSFDFPNVRVFSVEAGRFNCLEKRLNLPPVPVDIHSLVRTVEAYKNQKFRLAIRVPGSCPGKTGIFSLLSDRAYDRRAPHRDGHG